MFQSENTYTYYTYLCCFTCNVAVCSPCLSAGKVQKRIGPKPGLQPRGFHLPSIAHSTSQWCSWEPQTKEGNAVTNCDHQGSGFHWGLSWIQRLNWGPYTLANCQVIRACLTCSAAKYIKTIGITGALLPTSCIPFARYRYARVWMNHMVRILIMPGSVTSASELML